MGILTYMETRKKIIFVKTLIEPSPTLVFVFPLWPSSSSFGFLFPINFFFLDCRNSLVKILDTTLLDLVSG